MSKSQGDSSVPSGFFAQTAQRSHATANSSSRPAVTGTGGLSQQRGHFHNYGQPANFFNYGEPSQQGHVPSSSVPPSRKRGREEMFRCEPCDLELDSAIALESHKKSHVKCNGCDFEGAPKVVKGHFQSVHGKFSGNGWKNVTVAIPGCPVQRFRICVGNRPEDVQKWIEERKKRFPRSRPVQSEPKVELKAGLSTLLDGYSSSEDEHDDAAKPPAESPAIESSVVQKSEEKSTTPQKKPCHSFVRHGNCRRGDACPYRHDESLRKPKRNGRKQNGKKRDLLSNLLESDADREMKLSLQLVHYIVQSDFLRKRV
uniref:C3H1-type domain-containing protein n=1 Tax=Amphora coffeiformis TaxID=265554 RepID=A0A7S3L4K5_9STRA